MTTTTYVMADTTDMPKLVHQIKFAEKARSASVVQDPDFQVQKKEQQQRKDLLCLKLSTIFSAYQQQNPWKIHLLATERRRNYPISTSIHWMLQSM